MIWPICCVTMKTLWRKYYMNSYPELVRDQNGDSKSFEHSLDSIEHSLFTDPYYTSFDAMHGTTQLVDDYLRNSFDTTNGQIIAGGSLGRGEMLPNSDVDIFMLGTDLSSNGDKQSIPSLEKTEVGKADENMMQKIIGSPLVDGNRLVDGRVLTGNKERYLSILIKQNTTDRQLANIISEFFYFRCFDYPHKHTIYGPNLKYSSGSSRDLIFFDWAYRLDSQILPAMIESSGSEIEDSLNYIQKENEIYLSQIVIDILLTSKNAAIHLFNRTEDARVKYCSPETLRLIYGLCEHKMLGIGIRDEDQFISTYYSGRVQIEDAVNRLMHNILDKYLIGYDHEAPIATLIKDDELLHSKLALKSWITSSNSSSTEEIDKHTKTLMTLPVGTCWGGIMAMICSPYINDNTLSTVAEWLNNSEDGGAYLLKLIARSTNASQKTKDMAKKYYASKEIIK